MRAHYVGCPPLVSVTQLPGPAWRHLPLMLSHGIIQLAQLGRPTTSQQPFCRCSHFAWRAGRPSRGLVPIGTLHLPAVCPFVCRAYEISFFGSMAFSLAPADALHILPGFRLLVIYNGTLFFSLFAHCLCIWCPPKCVLSPRGTLHFASRALSIFGVRQVGILSGLFPIEPCHCAALCAFICLSQRRSRTERHAPTVH